MLEAGHLALNPQKSITQPPTRPTDACFANGRQVSGALRTLLLIWSSSGTRREGLGEGGGDGGLMLGSFSNREEQWGNNGRGGGQESLRQQGVVVSAPCDPVWAISAWAKWPMIRRVLAKVVTSTLPFAKSGFDGMLQEWFHPSALAGYPIGPEPACGISTGSYSTLCPTVSLWPNSVIRSSVCCPLLTSVLCYPCHNRHS